MTNDLIAQARKRYLAEHPVRVKSMPAFASDGSQAGSMSFPDLGDTQIVAAKLGMEFLAVCHDDELVEEWIQEALGVAKDPLWAGVLFANVFRGINIVIGTIIGDAGLRGQMEKLAVNAWTKDFGPGGDA